MLQILDFDKYYRVNKDTIIKLFIDEDIQYKSDQTLEEIMKNYPDYELVLINPKYNNIFPDAPFISKKLTKIDEYGDEIEYTPNEYYKYYKDLQEKEGGVLVKIYLYDHSGLWLTTEYDQWDSIGVGFVYCKNTSTSTLREIKDFVEYLDKEFVTGYTPIYIACYDNELNEIDSYIFWGDDNTTDINILKDIEYTLGIKIDKVKKINVIPHTTYTLQDLETIYQLEEDNEKL